MRRLAIGLTLSSLAVSGALAPQLLPQLLKELKGVIPTALADEEAEKAALQAQIDDRNAKLKQVQVQLDAAKAQLNSTTGQRKTLQGEVSRLEGQINQLELGIKEDELTKERLGFEITSLNGDVVTLRSKMKDKQDAIAALLVQVQKNEGTSPLMALLSVNTLSDTVREAQSTHALQERVSADLASLRDIQGNVLNKIDSTNEKKTEAERRQLSAEAKRQIVADQQAERAKVLAATKNKESSYQAQVAALLKQQQQIAAETEALDAALRAKINRTLLPTSGKGVLGMPVAGRVTQGYGATSFAATGYAGKWHNGIDIGAPIGTPIYAAADGTVTAAGNQDAYCPRGAYGKFTVITHTNGLVTLYGHQSKQVVSAGQTVKRGDIIGYVGSTGYATGPHLHLTVYAQSTFSMGGSKVCGPMPHGGDLNPLNYI
jgi:murein DD-endopeptidase MepM/ murein hydrolase activator NlpD